MRSGISSNLSTKISEYVADPKTQLANLFFDDKIDIFRQV